jgi:hypothetical protein
MDARYRIAGWRTRPDAQNIAKAEPVGNFVCEA